MPAKHYLTAVAGIACAGAAAAMAEEQAKSPAGPLEFRIVAEKDGSDPGAIRAESEAAAHPAVEEFLETLAEEGPAKSPDARLVWRKIAEPVAFLGMDDAADLADVSTVQSHSRLVVGRHDGDGYVLVHDEDGKKMAAAPGEAASWSVVSATTEPVPDQGYFSVRGELDERGGDMLAELTRRHIGQSICICVGGEAFSSAKIMEAVGREFQITGNFDENRARAIARTLLTNPAAMAGPPARRAE